MEAGREARRVRIYVSEHERWHHQPLYLAIVDHLRRQGAAGVSVFRGIAGFGVHRKIHAISIEALSTDLPVVVEWIDAPERVEALLPGVSQLVAEGVITVEAIEIYKQARREPVETGRGRAVSEVMTRDPVTVRPDTPLRRLVELMIGEEYRALPVVDRDGHLVGIVTNGDLVQRGGLGARAELLETLEPAARERALADLEAGKTAEDIMTRDVVTAGPGEALADAAHRMALRRLKRLPVVDAEGHLLGVLSRLDVLRALAGEPTPVPGPAGAPAPSVPPGAVRVGDVMARQVPTVRADAPLGDVLAAVISTRLNRAVVVDDAGRPVGVITDAELLRRLDPEAQAGLAQVLMRRLPFRHGTPEERAEWRFQTGTRAADLMLTPVVTVTASTPIPEAIRRMVERRYKILPVVDDEGRLIGMVDRADLLRAAIAG